jgi:hypothetical protein
MNPPAPATIIFFISVTPLSAVFSIYPIFSCLNPISP